MTTYSSYIKTFSIITILLLGVTAAINLVIDPFGLFHLGNRISNADKPEFYKHLRMAKAHNIRQLKPDGIILGTSRGEFGIDPEHPGWKATKRYNLALSSANIYEALRYLQHAHAVNPLNEVVIGLDFFMFNANKDVESDFSESRLKSPTSLISTGWYRDLLRSLFTFDALSASRETLSADSGKPTIRYKSNGFRDDSNNWLRIIAAKGHRQASLKNERYTLIAYDGFPFFSLTEVSGKASPMAAFEQLLIFCRDEKISAKLFISPTHARSLELIYLIGLWDDFELWKTNLVSSMNTISPTTPLWDFSGFNTITTEPFPELNNTEVQMRWYWESSHYKKEVGNIILDKLFSMPAATSTPENFGTLLLPQTIDSHLKAINQDRIRYEKKFPTEVSELKALISETRGERLKLYKAHPELKSIHTF